MAFPLPDHLPRKQDVSSAILTKIGNATTSTLNAAEASQWLSELDSTILATKRQIHERISGSLPEFERQFNSAVSVQERLASLKRNVGQLDTAVSAPETGLVDSLLRNLSAHSTLSQDKTDVDSLHNALHQLSILRTSFNHLTELVSEGRLPQAVESIHKYENLLQALPSHIARSQVVLDLRQRFSTTRARTEDQLDDAYSRGVQISLSEVTVLQAISVRQTDVFLKLPDIISSLSATSLTQNLGVLRRNLLAVVDHIIAKPLTIESSEMSHGVAKLSIVQEQSMPDDPFARLTNLTLLLDFLAEHLFPHLPSTFLVTLSKPISTSLLQGLLIPSLPSTFGGLPTYLLLTEQVVSFEQQYISKLLDISATDFPLKDWISGVSGHYERQRRTQILGHARSVFMTSSTMPSFTAEIVIQPPEPLVSSVIPVQEDEEEVENGEEDAWGLNDETSDTSRTHGSDETEAWGLDDDLEEVSAESANPPSVEPTSQSEPDSSDAWGWGDEDDLDPLPDDDDDPWADPPTKEEAQPPTPPHQLPAATPKVAKGLAKLAKKNKAASAGSSSAAASPAPQHPPSPPPSHPALGSAPEIRVRPPQLAPTIPAPISETYRVSGQMKELVATVESILRDAEQFSSEGAKLFPSSSSSTHGKTLYQTASAVLDMYRALQPLRIGSQHKTTPEIGFQYSNDLFWLSEQVEELDEEKFSDEVKRLKAVSERWFDETISQQRIDIQTSISEGSKGFVDTGNQEQYDECEAAVNGAVQQIKSFARQWKNILPAGRYYTALGLVVDGALSHVMADILDLHDIPELESGRLAELCRIFKSLEGLFSRNVEQPSFAPSYIPSWFKFTYLSELLEASMADITYLFEEGLLVDFETDELVRLVKGLFADNVLRTTTINKIMAGHPEV
ncbi:hypothetical protein DL96DRAFT_1584707 [Flagelloscypha sp. PMI_526]|nr:hypothetical protein DL96DRAFT_1584707 [Flagelloscypha sp. PMI_526]